MIERSALYFRRRCVIFCVALSVLAAGCAAPGAISPASDSAFQRTGRFALSVNTPAGTQDAVQGGFAWLDTGRTLTLDLANPLGSTLARVTVKDGVAMLEHSNGAQEYAPHADALVEKVLGSPVPVSGLRDWLRGQTGSKPVSDTQMAPDTGQLSEFTQDGWRVRLSRYDAQGPTVLQMNRNDAGRAIRVRLVVTAQSE